MLEKIALITPPTKSHRTAEETLALGYLSTVLRKARYEVSIVDGWLEQLTAQEIVEKLSIGRHPAIVGISCYRSNLEQAVEVLGVIRNHFGNIPIICGGYGPTFHDEDFLKQGFSVVVTGEAEHTIVPLVESLLNDRVKLKDVPGIVFWKNDSIVRTSRVESIVDLDQIAFPARDTVQEAIKRNDFVHMCTSRGCGASCIFCSIFAFALGGSRKLRWRFRTVANIVDEIEYLYQQYSVRHFKFVDDSFIEAPRDERWAYAFRDELLKRRLSIRFRTQVRADRLTPELVLALKGAGWFSTSIGIENASASALKRMLKSASQAHNIVALKMLEQNGIYVQMGMILFDPYTTVSELWENFVFLKTHTWPVNKGIFTEMYAAEGTLFTKKLKQRSLISDVAEAQNYNYLVQDLQARRVHAMLKQWHLSHSPIYDWVIDSITAPKILPDEGYKNVHALCQELQSLDLWFFESALRHISSIKDMRTDTVHTAEAIHNLSNRYSLIRDQIGHLYVQYGLHYNGVPNPFL